MQVKTDSEAVYGQILKKIFSGEVAPGTQLVERQLATELGVSRVPVRESLTRLVAQGVLSGGEKGQGVRVRNYSANEVRHLYEFREMIEGGVAKAAAKYATESEIVAMEMVCDQMECEIGNYGSSRWASLDHKFHKVMANASRNERFIHALMSLLTESHYVFYLHPARGGRPRPSDELARSLMEKVVKDHRSLLELIRLKKPDKAEALARQHMRASADRANREIVANDLLD